MYVLVNINSQSQDSVARETWCVEILSFAWFSEYSVLQTCGFSTPRNSQRQAGWPII